MEIPVNARSLPMSPSLVTDQLTARSTKRQRLAPWLPQWEPVFAERWHDCFERVALPMIHGVTVIGDVLRPDGRGQPGGVDRATVWLFDAIKRQLRLAGGLPIDVMTAGDWPALRTWLDSLRPPEAAHRYWAGAYERLPLSAVAETILMPRLQHRFCIGYELPPWLHKLLQQTGVPYVDVRLHPVRFLDDLLF